MADSKSGERPNWPFLLGRTYGETWQEDTGIPRFSSIRIVGIYVGKYRQAYIHKFFRFHLPHCFLVHQSTPPRTNGKPPGRYRLHTTSLHLCLGCSGCVFRSSFYMGEWLPAFLKNSALHAMIHRQTLNSLRQDACVVAAYLMTACIPGRAYFVHPFSEA